MSGNQTVVDGKGGGSEGTDIARQPSLVREGGRVPVRFLRWKRYRPKYD